LLLPPSDIVISALMIAENGERPAISRLMRATTSRLIRRPFAQHNRAAIAGSAPTPFSRKKMRKKLKKSGKCYEQARRLLLHFGGAAGEMKGHHGQQGRLRVFRTRWRKRSHTYHSLSPYFCAVSGTACAIGSPFGSLIVTDSWRTTLPMILRQCYGGNRTSIA
jgi:hypothetical protein